MPESRGDAAHDSPLVLRVSVPAHGDLRRVATLVAGKLAEYLGSAPLQDAAVDVMDSLAASVAPPNGDSVIAFEFRRGNSVLVIEAECNGRSSEVRYPLPA
jgi:hypothetical protein